MNACRFCTMPGTPHGSVYWTFDKYAVTDGHILIIPRRHIVSWFEATVEETADLLATLVELRADSRDWDPTVTGFNFGINDGVSAGQTVMHAHAHLIPRRDGDMDDPAGGVRGVIPDKQKYEVS
jgi:ATP adenylyltransferase